ncbi:hypothetical protein DSLPV1_196 [Dishui lake phycodnavirus 1]|uniref:hypothetical protein n=1 Tax=Dishui lake phycodnavirus 1 TaxID=2079134 RepID=UPI000CD6B59F|nr:hypothetical protein C5Y57_gp202 [Dishui lake phycodnavirus 1]AUT19167.1 hypothetical protein DSLPV1_196 [Dishui lake phycodnavirus 1]
MRLRRTHASNGFVVDESIVQTKTSVRVTVQITEDVIIHQGADRAFVFQVHTTSAKVTDIEPDRRRFVILLLKECRERLETHDLTLACSHPFKHVPRRTCMIYVQWRRTCYLCDCPLDIEVDFDDDEDEAMWKLCMDFVPGEERFLENKLHYKKLGGRVYRTCRSCFELKFRCNPAIIRDLETGVSRRHPPQPRGYTRDELEVWVDMCQRFIRDLRASDTFGRR